MEEERALPIHTSSSRDDRVREGSCTDGYSGAVRGTRVFQSNHAGPASPPYPQPTRSPGVEAWQCAARNKQTAGVSDDESHLVPLCIDVWICLLWLWEQSAARIESDVL